MKYLLQFLLFGLLTHLNVYLAQETKVFPDDSARNTQFGNSVSISGEYAIIASSRDNAVNHNGGSAYIFKNDGSGWIQTAKLIPNDGAADDMFGNSVAIYGDYAVVGAYLNDEHGTNCGAAYVFKRNNDAWNQTAKLIPSDVSAGWIFGYCVAIYDDIIAVGSPSSSTPGWTGIVSVFQRQGSEWREIQTIAPESGVYGENFGCSVALSDDYLVVGADKVGAPNTGSVYVYNKGSDGWELQDNLIPSGSYAGDEFGNSVSISGVYILVGGSSSAFNSPAYIFKREGGNWSEQSKLLPDDNVNYNRFAENVFIHGYYAFIGARNAVVGADECNGAVYVFAMNGNNSWVQTKKIVASDGSNGDNFGVSVAATDKYLLVGADAAWVGGPNSGAAYFYTSNDFISTVDNNEVPQNYFLSQNYPNPLSKGSGGSPSGKIKFSIAKEGEYILQVFNALGQKVAIIEEGYYRRGNYTAEFHAPNLPSGVYVYQLSGENIRISKKMIILK